MTARDGVIRAGEPAAGRGPPAGRRSTPFQVDLTGRCRTSWRELTAAFEERYLRKALRKTRGHVGKCAKISGLSRRSITDKIAQYKIDKAEFKEE